MRKLLLAIALFASCASFAAQRTVRVAFREDAGLAFFNESGARDGYYIVLMNRLAAALDLRIEWVDVPWGETMNYIKAGKLDVIPGPANIPVFREGFTIGHVPIGYWRMGLYALAGTRLDASDFKTMDGVVIGVPVRHPANFLLEKYLAECRVGCTFKEYRDRATLERALVTGEVGAIFSETTESLRDEKTLFALPSEPMYMGVCHGEEELLDDIDHMLANIRDNEPDYFAALRSRFFRYERSMSVLFDARELDWLARQKREGKVFIADLTPVDGFFKRKDPRTGMLTGCAVALLEEITDLIGLDFAVESSIDHETAVKRFREGAIQLSMPYGCHHNHHIRENGGGRAFSIRIPQAVCTRRFESVEVSSPEVHVAVSGKDISRISAYRGYGMGDRLVVCNDEAAALEALADGRADCFVGDYPVVRLSVERSDSPEDFEVRIIDGARYRPQFPVQVSPLADPQLASILAKTVSAISGDRLVQLADRTVALEAWGRGLSVGQVLKIVIPVSTVLLLVAVTILVISRRKIRYLLHRAETSLLVAQESIDESSQARKDLKRALEKAEFDAKSKSNFLATMSHEIRTPLNAVIGYSEFLSDPSTPSDKVGEYARGITLSANALLSLVNDILDISKFESGKREGLDMRIGECDLRNMFDEMRTVFRLRCRNKGIGIEFSIAQDFPLLVLAEPRVRQIALNLIGNAVKFTDAGGITVSAEFSNGTLVMRFKDTGIGITDRGKKYIFDPFAQDMDSRRGKIYAGTGLGLSIVKRLVESSGGTIRVDSTVGKGSEFTITIPDVKEKVRVKGEKTKGAAGAGSAVGPGGKIRNVVIVDDMALNRQILQLHCQSLGLSDIKTFGAATEVIEYLIAGNLPDLVLSDMWMPGMDGAQLSAEISAKWPQVPVVAVTADTDAGGKFDMSHFRAVLAKPVTGDKLKKLFEELEK